MVTKSHRNGNVAASKIQISPKTPFEEVLLELHKEIGCTSLANKPFLMWKLVPTKRGAANNFEFRDEGSWLDVKVSFKKAIDSARKGTDPYVEIMIGEGVCYFWLADS